MPENIVRLAADRLQARDSALNRNYVTRLVAAIGAIVVLAVAMSLPTKYATLTPGPVFDTFGEFDGEPMLTFGPDVKTYPTDGAIDFTTVSVSRSEARLSVAQVMGTYLFTDDAAVLPRSVVHRADQSDEESQEESAAQLDMSKDSSRVAALRAAGYEVPSTPKVAQVEPGSPADGKLRADDLLLQVDGAKVAEPQEVVNAVRKVKPGGPVTVLMSRDGNRRAVKLITEPSPDDEAVPRIGVGVGAEYEFPLAVENNVGDSIGGPSAGTMFALAIYDKLTPGSLTGGRQIAGTGAISSTGDVEPIGGVRQKIAGAAAEGAEVFLVPEGNCAEAVAGGDKGLLLLKIDTLDDAITSLNKLAKNAKAKVPQCR